MSFKYAEFDLTETNWLPSNWQEQVFSVSASHSKRVHLNGKSSTSREPSDTKGIDYHVVLGQTICREMQWLQDLYVNQFADLAAQVNQEAIEVSPETDTGVNINILSGVGARYEWHVDSNPLTGLLFVTSHADEDGGHLLFRTSSGDRLVQPKSGTLLLFDARNVPHTVLPLGKAVDRISIPMNYYTSEFTIDKVRPADLDSYIY